MEAPFQTEIHESTWLERTSHILGIKYQIDQVLNLLSQFQRKSLQSVEWIKSDWLI